MHSHTVSPCAMHLRTHALSPSPRGAQEPHRVHGPGAHGGPRRGQRAHLRLMPPARGPVLHCPGQTIRKGSLGAGRNHTNAS
jgi:hypothetical protein